jgi:D-3-phosphoglycerate dehydrogenase
VAELVIGLTVMLVRGIFPRSWAAHRGAWLKTARDSRECRGRVLGIVGYGHIGSQVSILAEALGMQVIYHDIETKLNLGNATPAASLAELLAGADVVTLHVPDTPLTRGLIGAEELDRMREGACLINASRGSVVDVEALAARLASGRLAGAAVDVFPREPGDGDEEFRSPLRGQERAILTPHIGGSTLEAQESIGREVALKLATYSDRGSTLGAVNFPQLNLVEQDCAHRVLHIHRNQPGVLQQINTILAEQGINVLGQHLQTTARVGYVVLDIERHGNRQLLDALKRVDGTIRARILY